MKKLLLALCAAAVVVPAAVAGGGGFATVGVSSLPPAEMKPGAEWAVDLTVRAHGQTPVDGVQPVIRLRGPDGGLTEIAATKTKRTGVYRAVVRFPTAGTWTYEIWDGYAQTHTYKPVTVGAPGTPVAPLPPQAVGEPSSGFPTLPVAALALGLALAAALAVFLRRHRSVPEPAPLRH